MSDVRNGRSPIVGISMFSARESHKFYTKVQYNYVQSVVDAGGLPWLVPTLEDLERAAEIAESLDALVLTGGEDMSPFTFNAQPRKELGTTNHYRDRWELALLAACENRGIPILGICRGIQVMNVHRRGTLYQDINAETESVLGHALSSDPMESLHHTISIDDGSLLYRIFETEELLVNSFHHQAVRDLGEGLTVTSTAADGIIEGVEDPSRPFYLGIQFHAEALPPIDSYYLRIFSALVEAAGEPLPEVVQVGVRSQHEHLRRTFALHQENAGVVGVDHAVFRQHFGELYGEPVVGARVPGLVPHRAHLGQEIDEAARQQQQRHAARAGQARPRGKPRGAMQPPTGEYREWRVRHQREPDIGAVAVAARVEEQEDARQQQKPQRQGRRFPPAPPFSGSRVG